MKTTPLLLAVMTFALNLNAGTDERLAACRQQIDTLHLACKFGKELPGKEHRYSI
jgi:hypothetical protein